jgi:glycosyltransferase involved in cell wall biosynthesis
VIARFTELKGIQYIIPAFQNLLKLYPDALLLLFNAHGDYENEIKSQLKKLLPAENYHLIPFETDLGAAYRLMDVFIQVSIDRTIEAFGQTYIEALASGIPSIFTLSGIASDFIEDKKNALVVPYKNSDAIFDRLLEILTNQEGALLMAAQGRRDVEHNFSLKKMVHSLERLYDC